MTIYRSGTSAALSTAWAASRLYSPRMISSRRTPPLLLAGVFTVSGITHMVRPQFFEAIMPRALPGASHRPLIYASGVVELVCAWGLFRRTRWASSASVAVLAAVFPANLQMALDSGSGRHPGAMDRADVAWGRLPLQLAMVWAARQARPEPAAVNG
jgi:uncharacterized membrane protein